MKNLGYYKRYRTLSYPRVWVSREEYLKNPDMYEVEYYPVNAKLHEDKVASV